MTWWQGRMVGFDLETTGVDVEEDRIVTAALVVVGAAGPPVTTHWLVDPGVEIPDEVAAIHGVTTERARADGAPAAEAVRQIAEAVASFSDHPLCVFNARFDLTILDRECRRHDIGPLPLVHGPVIDPLMIDKHLDRFRKGSRKLDAICATYGAVLDGAHEAGSDALAACRAAWVLGAKGQVIRKIRPYGGHARGDAIERAQLVREWEEVRGDLALLTDAQRRWARVQAISLRAYFAEKGQAEDAASVREEWPVVPVPALATDGKREPDA